MPGPLHGVTVVELAGLGPGPFCGMLLGDLGADVVRVDRTGDGGLAARSDPLLRNRRSLQLDLKKPGAAEVVLRLVTRADMLIEGFRPGVAERLGVGPEACLAANARLVYGRMTGFGQQGPLAERAGHDINYLAMTGLLNLLGGPDGRPAPPLNLLGDYAGGGLFLAFGLLAAYVEARRSGRGQVVDAAMIDGTLLLGAALFGFRALGLVQDSPGQTFLAGAAPWYDTYRTRDGGFVAVGALEPQFYGALLDRLGLDRERFMPLGFPRMDAATRARWPELRAALSEAFAQRTRDEWAREFEGVDACVTPVLRFEEVAAHPHTRARGALLESGAVTQPAPGPRFSATPPPPVRPPRVPGEDTDDILAGAGFDAAEIDALRARGVLGR